MGNHQLNRLVATKLVEIEFVGQFHPFDGRIRPDVAVDPEGNAVEFHRTTFTFEHDFQVPFTHDALLDQLEHPMKQRLREVLPPWAGMPQGTGQFQVKLFHRQGAVRQQATCQVFFAQLPCLLYTSDAADE